ncbi:MAG: hypothetical protein ACPHBP_08045, partial [Flavobacteriaceae bacterium]
ARENGLTIDMDNRLPAIVGDSNPEEINCIHFAFTTKEEIMENIIWENKYSFYVNYLEKTKNIDFDWNLNMRFKVNSKISGNFILHLLYDDDLLGKLQVRELLGLGINIDL